MAKFSKYNQPKRNRNAKCKKQSYELYEQMTQLTSQFENETQKQIIIDAYKLSL